MSPRRAHDAAALAAFLPYVEAVDLDEGAALHYVEIRADLKRRGVMIGANDLFIRRARPSAGTHVDHEQHGGVQASA